MKTETLENVKLMIKNGQFGSEDLQDILKYLLVEKPEIVDEAMIVSDKELMDMDLKIQRIKDGVGGRPELDFCVATLSRRYSAVLTQINTLETQMEACGDLREQMEAKSSMFLLGIFPCILFSDLLIGLKASVWAEVKWEAEKELGDVKISDFARLTEIWVEPNKMWDGVVRFVFKMKGYVTESDFQQICVKINRNASYYSS